MDPAFGPFVDRCQRLALGLPEMGPASGLSELAGLVGSLPPVTGEAGQAVVFHLLIKLLAGVAIHAGLSEEQEVSRRFFHVTKMLGPASKWLVEFTGLVDCCVHLAKSRTEPAPTSVEAIVRPILHLIDGRFADRDLSLQDAARAAGCSIAYASRVLTEETGRSFTVHLRDRRVAAAKELLVQTSLTMKEIASTSGFGTAAGFSRQFRRVERQTPTEYRRAHKKSVDPLVVR